MIENARIISTMLGHKDCPCFTAYINLEIGYGGGCFYGGYALDDYDPAKGERVAMKGGFQSLFDLMNTLEVDSWEQLPGRFVRVEHDGSGSKVTRIGHLMKDKWFSFAEFMVENGETIKP